MAWGGKVSIGSALHKGTGTILLKKKYCTKRYLEMKIGKYDTVGEPK